MEGARKILLSHRSGRSATGKSVEKNGAAEKPAAPF
jgi:hypothetical protein